MLQREGIELVLSSNVTKARRDGDDYVLELENGQELRGDRILVATGQRPRVKGIGLDTVGVEENAHGVPVDSHLRAADGLWAIGDVNGIWPLTHVGKYQGEVVADNILGTPREANYEAVPRVVYTDPQAAAVGASTAAYSATVPITEIAKIATYTRAYADDKGFITLLSDGDRLTGAYALGPEAGRMAPAGHPGDPQPPPPRRPRRHDPALPDLLRDLRRRPQEAAPAGCRWVEVRGRTDHIRLKAGDTVTTALPSPPLGSARTRGEAAPMDYLVTMTTHVPDGTSDAAVEDVRAREAAHSRELASRGTPPPPLAASRCSRASGGRSASSQRPTEPSSSQCSSPCLCGYGAPMTSPRSRRIPTTLARRPRKRYRRTAGRGERIPHHLHDRRPTGDAKRHRRCHRGERGRQGKGARRARKASAAVGAVRRGSDARTVAGHDAGEMEAMLDSLPLREWSDVETIPLAPHPSDPGSGPR